MAIVTPLVIGAYELGVLAVGTITALYLASPPGQKASRDAAKAASDALDRIEESMASARRGKPSPIPKTGELIQVCPNAEHLREKCPVCGIGVNPTPGAKPAYVLAQPPRAPKDWETIPPLRSFKPTSRTVHGARVYEGPSGRFFHVDTFHKGRGSEVEFYDKSGNHLGAICPHCGSVVAGPVPGRKLPR